MPSAQIIDGKAMAASVRARVTADVAELKRKKGIVPGLAAVLVGDDPASHTYVRSKARALAEAGMRAFEHRLPASLEEEALLELIGSLNRDDDVHGILVQLPLPPHISGHRVLEAIDPAKDVDGFNPVNVGRLSTGESSLVPCTPAGSHEVRRVSNAELTCKTTRSNAPRPNQPDLDPASSELISRRANRCRMSATAVTISAT